MLASVDEPFGNSLRMSDSLRGCAKHNTILGLFEKYRPAFYQSKPFPQIGREAHSSLWGYVNLNRHFAFQML